MKHSDNLTLGQEKALAALMVADTLEAAIAAAGCSRTSMFRWLREPAFATRYRELRRDALRQATARLQQLAGKAVQALAAVLEDAAATPASKVRAADSILAHAFQAYELEDLAARIEALERMEEARNANKGR